MPEVKRRLQDPALRRLRAMRFIEGRLHNMSIGEIAAEFNLSEKTISREIDWAKRHNLVADYEEQILGNLVPKAIKAFEIALDAGDAQAALEVLKGTGLLRKPSTKPLTAPESQEDSLEIHIKKITGKGSDATKRALKAAGESSADVRRVLENSTSSPQVIEASLVEARDENRSTLDE